MSVSHRRNERLERESENRAFQKSIEKSTFHVGDDQKILKMRTAKRHEHVKCARPWSELQYSNGKVRVLRQNGAPIEAIFAF
jgi:hypothetical protein